MERLRELRGSDARELDLASILGFDPSRSVRWKEGRMYVDSAEYLVRLADALVVDTMLLVAIASGGLTVEQAHRQIARANRKNGGMKRKSARSAESLELANDASLLAFDGAKFEPAGRWLVVLIAGNGKGRIELGEAVGRHADITGVVCAGLPIGIALAERWRPELIFLDLGVANVHAFEACRVLSNLTGRARRRCRVVAGTATVTDDVKRPALMAGAAAVNLFPFSSNLFESELDRIEERFGSRGVTRR
jgi:CheY-like chemotaxis protein